jgi:hypothetical protein
MSNLNVHAVRIDSPPVNSAIAPASRNANPFATCWTRPGAISYCFRNGDSASHLVARLAQNEWRGAIIGPHGSGKSTLLMTLIPLLQADGFQIHAITLRDRQRCLPARFLADAPNERAILIVDGYEQLGWLQRLRLNRFCRTANRGLLVAAHAPVRLATLIRLAPDEPLVQKLVVQLAKRIPTPITPEDVSASHACYGENVRDVLFDLYDRHEKRRRRALPMNSGVEGLGPKNVVGGISDADFALWQTGRSLRP